MQALLQKGPVNWLPILKAAGESYFAHCPRDEHGHCLPSGEANRSGQQPTKPAAPASKLPAKPEPSEKPAPENKLPERWATEDPAMAREVGAQQQIIEEYLRSFAAIGTGPSRGGQVTWIMDQFDSMGEEVAGHVKERLHLANQSDHQAAVALVHRHSPPDDPGGHSIVDWQRTLTSEQRQDIRDLRGELDTSDSYDTLAGHVRIAMDELGNWSDALQRVRVHYENQQANRPAKPAEPVHLSQHDEAKRKIQEILDHIRTGDTVANTKRQILDVLTGEGTGSYESLLTVFGFDQNATLGDITAELVNHEFTFHEGHACKPGERSDLTGCTVQAHAEPEAQPASQSFNAGTAAFEDARDRFRAVVLEQIRAGNSETAGDKASEMVHDLVRDLPKTPLAQLAHELQLPMDAGPEDVAGKLVARISDRLSGEAVDLKNKIDAVLAKIKNGDTSPEDVEQLVYDIIADADMLALTNAGLAAGGQIAGDTQVLAHRIVAAVQAPSKVERTLSRIQGVLNRYVAGRLAYERALESVLGDLHNTDRETVNEVARKLGVKPEGKDDVALLTREYLADLILKTVKPPEQKPIDKSKLLPQRYGKSKAKLKIALEGQGLEDLEDADEATLETAQESVAKIFSTKAEVGDIPSLVGAPDDAEVTLSPRHSGYSGDYLQIEVKHPLISEMNRTIRKNADGTIEMHNSNFFMKETGHDNPNRPFSGSDVLARAVEQAQAHGVNYITTYAAGGFGRSMNGYYTWPLLGFDESFDDLEEDGERETVQAAREEFPDANSVLDVFAEPGGSEWWRQNGSELDHAKFDLTPGSRSLDVMTAYMAKRAAKKKSKTKPKEPEPEKPAESPPALQILPSLVGTPDNALGGPISLPPAPTIRDWDGAVDRLTHAATHAVGPTGLDMQNRETAIKETFDFFTTSANGTPVADVPQAFIDYKNALLASPGVSGKSTTAGPPNRLPKSHNKGGGKSCPIKSTLTKTNKQRLTKPGLKSERNGQAVKVRSRAKAQKTSCPRNRLPKKSQPSQSRQKGSYFSDCPRDEHGHCLRRGEGSRHAAPKPKPAKPAAEKPADKPDAPFTIEDGRFHVRSDRPYKVTDYVPEPRVTTDLLANPGMFSGMKYLLRAADEGPGQEGIAAVNEAFEELRGGILAEHLKIAEGDRGWDQVVKYRDLLLAVLGKMDVEPAKEKPKLTPEQVQKARVHLTERFLKQTDDWLDRSYLEEGQTLKYHQAMSDTLKAMSLPALKRIDKTVQSIKFYPNLGQLSDAFQEETGEYVPRGATLEGVSNIKSGEMLLNGVLSSDPIGVSGVYAHELGHMIDRRTDLDYRSDISLTWGWLRASEKEVLARKDTLSEYAKSGPAEAFAEYHRLLCQKPEEAKTKYPLMYAIFKKRGLLDD